jgi:hypothetical protein
MTPDQRPATSLRWAWLIPAIASALATLGLVIVLDVLIDDGNSDLPRHQVAAPASTSAASSTPTIADSGPPGDIVLEAGGLGVVQFGEPAIDVVDVFSARLGTPDEDDQQQCGRTHSPSRWVRWADLSLHFSPGRFTGYIEGIHFPPGRKAFDFATRQGLSPGDSMQRLHELYGNSLRVRTEPPQSGRPASMVATLARAPTTGAMSAVIERQKDHRIVTSIFAGDLC